MTPVLYVSIGRRASRRVGVCMTSTQLFRNLAIVLWIVALFSPFASAETESEVISVEPVTLLTDEELQDLVGPIALYPDDLIAIVLPASTYPLQIVEAARYRERAEGDNSAEPDENWDESIVALLNYPEVLDKLNEDLDWTWKLGQAVLDQQEDVLDAVQEFRRLAHGTGNLKSDEKQTVRVAEEEVIVIEPVEKEVIYVPYYEPERVIVYQSDPVYYYHPRPYPLYYYPYVSYHNHNWPFWGLSSFFSLSWSSHYIHHYRHDHRAHRYFNHRYRSPHFKRTHRYHRPYARDRRIAHRRHDGRRHHRYRGEYHWRPDRRYAGVRPRHFDRRHRPEGRRPLIRHDQRRRLGNPERIARIDRPRRDVERPRRDLERPRRDLEHPRRNIERPRRNIERPRRDVDRPRRNADRPGRDVERRRRVADRPRDINRNRPGRSVVHRSPREVNSVPHVDPPRNPARANRSDRGRRADPRAASANPRVANSNPRGARVHPRIARANPSARQAPRARGPQARTPQTRSLTPRRSQATPPVRTAARRQATPQPTPRRAAARANPAPRRASAPSPARSKPIVRSNPRSTPKPNYGAPRSRADIKPNLRSLQPPQQRTGRVQRGG